MSDIPPPHSTKVTMLKTASQRRSSLEEGSTRGLLCLAHAGHDAMNFSFTSMQRDKAQFQRPIIRSCHIRPEDRALSLVPSLPCDRAHAAVCPISSRGQPSAALRPPRISRRLNYIAHVAKKLSNCMDLQKIPLLPAYLNPSLQINTWKKKSNIHWHIDGKQKNTLQTESRMVNSLCVYKQRAFFLASEE